MGRVKLVNSLGKKVPSVTTISKLYGDNGALIYWANSQGLDGKTLQDAYATTATPGSMAHERIDFAIKGQEYTTTHFARWATEFTSEEAFANAHELALMAYENFQRWQIGTHCKLHAGEVSLVSEQYQFGGTLDAVATSSGLALADWKTGSGVRIYPEMLYQLAGYSILWAENFPNRPLTGGYHILRVSRESATFGHYHFKEIDDARRGFLLLREMFDIHKLVSARVK